MPKKITEEELARIQWAVQEQVCDVCFGERYTKVIPDVVIFGKVITTSISPIEVPCYKCNKQN